MNAHFLLVAAIAAHLATASGDDVNRIPDSIPFTMTAHANPDVSIRGVLLLNESITFNNAFVTPYMSLWQLPAEEFGGKFKIEPKFEFLGPEDPDQRICVELRVLNRDGKLIYHDWHLCGDQRLGPDEVDFGAYRCQLSRLSSPGFRVPFDRVAGMDRVEIRFREIPADRVRHFPSRSHEFDPRLTKRDANGEFEVSFKSPEGGVPADRLPAFELLVIDSKERLVRSEFRVVDLLPDTERYRFKVKVEPEYYDYSSVRLGFFSPKHGRSKEYLRTHLNAKWPVNSSGFSDGGKLIELPLEGAKPFDDLPEVAPK